MSDRQTLRVVLADDHPIFLDGLANLIGTSRMFEIVALCNDGACALQAIRENKPDLAVLDIAMPHLTGLEVLDTVRSEHLDARVVFLTASATDEQLLGAIEKGAAGILLKDTVATTLLECLVAVSSGGTWQLPLSLGEAAERETQRRRKVERLNRILTPRELEVIMLVAEGLSNKEIARRTNVTEGTIKLHLHNIYGKLGVANRTALTRIALTLADRA
ncbi:response regulator [Microvirga sp. M2]|uniref:response regulator n=1 Tax=Microvirga sp. M2 TaxID=3073270 RepID=UPI0039C0CDF2